MAGRGPVRRRGKAYEVKLGDEERAALRDLCQQLRELLVKESPSSDPGVARLFPPAYPDDLLQNLDYERTAGNDLLAQRLAAIDIVSGSIDAKRLTEEQLLAWLSATNDLRLVMGTRLGVTEESTEADFAEDEAAEQAYGLYSYLTWLVAEFVEALGGD
ncbi:MAG: DUF2017 domain-containing protein [Actinomycetota bacterium]|nr:DUF2017 domain-containing protein [Actinomycetota bacterium]